MEPPNHPLQAGSKAATDEEIKRLVAETLLARAIKRHLAMNSPSNSKPSQTSTNKKPNE